MAQMTGAISPKALKIEYSQSGTNTGFTDMSGYATAIEASEGGRKVGEVYTFDGEYPIGTTGKMTGSDFTIRAVYHKSSATTNPYQFFRANFVSNSIVYVRWSPEGGATGDKQFVISGNVASCPPVSGPSDSPEAILFEAKVHMNAALIEGYAA